MVRHNNVVPNQHYKKHWCRSAAHPGHVKTWFNQPARAQKRRDARQKKAAAIFPRPTAGPLRPMVRSQTVKYNTKIRKGRGFTLEELKEAGISAKLAPTIGISVDHRRKNRSLETLQENVARLKAFKAKLVIFPRKSKKPKQGDSSPDELATATQIKGEILPIRPQPAEFTVVSVTDEMKKFNAYRKIRVERMNIRRVGERAKKAAESKDDDTAA